MSVELMNDLLDINECVEINEISISNNKKAYFVFKTDFGNPIKAIEQHTLSHFKLS